ncbi:MAG: HlyC/CorC family transporter [Phycisphaerales bacterium]|nr:MAG: HlyC/CorC family transporter [Phycisphaerales bacterium]
MSAPTLTLALAILALAILFGTANLSLRQLSRHRLAELLEPRGKAHWIENINKDLHFMILATSSVRHACHVVFIVAVAALLVEPIGGTSPTYYVVVAILSVILLLIFGVAVPNAWARHAGEQFVAATYPLLRACRVALSPAVSILHFFDGLVRRLAGIPPSNATSQLEEMEQEILDVVSEGERHGAVDEQEKEMIESVIAFADTQVGQVMTPRTQVRAVEIGAGLEDAKQLILKAGHSRIPVYESTIDNVQGILYAKDLLNVENPTDVKIADIMRPVSFIPETKNLRECLQQFQETKVHIAIILDEYGGTAGLITLEDLLEELVGDITDEYEEPEPEPIVRLDDGRADVDARLRISELNDELGVTLPENDDYDTVGGFVFSTLGRIPQPGEQFDHGNLRIEILDAEERRVKRLRIRVTQAQQEPS